MQVYIVVEAIKIQDLVDEVNQMIAKGWSLQGGCCDNNNYIIQAMVKDTVEDIISEEFIIKEKGYVPGETGPEFHFSYEYKGERGAANLGHGSYNYTDEELKEIIVGKPSIDVKQIKNVRASHNPNDGLNYSLTIDFDYRNKHYSFIKIVNEAYQIDMNRVVDYCVKYLEDRAT